MDLLFQSQDAGFNNSFTLYNSVKCSKQMADTGTKLQSLQVQRNRLRKGPSPSITGLSDTIVMHSCGEEMSDRLLKMEWEGKHTASRTTENNNYTSCIGHS